MAIETPFAFSDGDGLSVFFDARRGCLTDLGETAHRLIAGGVRLGASPWLTQFEMDLKDTGVQFTDGELFVSAPVNAVHLMNLLQAILRLSERGATAPWRGRPIFRETVKQFLHEDAHVAFQAQHRVIIADAQLTFDFYVPRAEAFIKTVATPARFAQNVALATVGTWSLVRFGCPESQRITILRPHVELPSVVRGQLEAVSRVMPWERRSDLVGLLSA